MFRTYQVLFNRLLLCLDVIIILGSFLFAWYIKFDSGLLPYGGHLTLPNYKGAVLLAVVTFGTGNWLSGLYKPRRSKSLWAELFAIARSSLFGLLIFMSGLYLVKTYSDFSRDVVVVFVIAFFLLTAVVRMTIRLALRAARKRGYNQRYMIIVGWNYAAERFVNALEQQPWFGYRVLGYLSMAPEEGPRHGVPNIGVLEDLEQLLNKHLIDQVVIAIPRGESRSIASVLSATEFSGVQSLVLPDYFDLLPARPRFESFGDIPLIDTRYVPLDDAVNAALKRTFDVVFSAIVMIVLCPLFVLILLGVKISSHGPAIHVQERVGRSRRVFKMYKFRTMIVEGFEDTAADDMAESGWTTPHDARRTSFGAFLRRTSLDELPQFWNVFIGDMSVIGPRPERPYYVEQFKEEVPRYMVKHRVRPGITGWAQVHGWRGDTSITERIQYDIEYIENWSFWMDIRIVFRTIKDGFLHENAY